MMPANRRSQTRGEFRLPSWQSVEDTFVQRISIQAFHQLSLAAIKQQRPLNTN